MSSAEIWAVIACLTGVTFLTRGFFLLIAHRAEIPPRVQRALRYAPGSALAAIVFPDLLLAPARAGAALAGTLSLGFDNHRLYAALAACLCFWFYRRGVIAVMVSGMLAYTALRWWV